MELPPPGRFGGHSGESGFNRIRRRDGTLEELATKQINISLHDGRPVPAGHIRRRWARRPCSPRRAELVADDIRQGRITPAADRLMATDAGRRADDGDPAGDGRRRCRWHLHRRRGRRRRWRHPRRQGADDPGRRAARGPPRLGARPRTGRHRAAGGDPPRPRHDARHERDPGAARGERVVRDDPGLRRPLSARPRSPRRGRPLRPAFPADQAAARPRADLRSPGADDGRWHAAARARSGRGPLTRLRGRPLQTRRRRGLFPAFLGEPGARAGDGGSAPRGTAGELRGGLLARCGRSCASTTAA